MQQTKAQLKVINGHYYLLFENGKIDRLDGLDENSEGLSFEQIAAAIYHFSNETIEVIE